jgi:hypothetical protein
VKRRMGLKRVAGRCLWRPAMESNGVDLAVKSIYLELNLSSGASFMPEMMMWRCSQVRAGQLYNRMMFDTKAEAEQFVLRMRPMEPDQTFSIEAIDASTIWN